MSEHADTIGVPLYTPTEAADILDLAPSTFRNWASGYTDARKHKHAGLITRIDSRRGTPSIPFIGLTEGLVLSAFRESGVPMQRIRPALQRIKDEMGLEHALASKRLYTDGAEVLYNYGQTNNEAAKDMDNLVVVRSGQHVLNEVIQEYLKQIEFDADGYARLVHAPRYRDSGVDVIVDPTRGFGQPIIARTAARVADVVSRIKAGDGVEAVADDFGLASDEVRGLLSAHPTAA